jgi:hypothetical protein
VKTEVVKIPWEGNTFDVVVKKLSWGERNFVIEEAVDTSSGTSTVEIDQTKWRNSLFLKSVVSLPFVLNQESLDSMDTDVADKIFDVVMKLNPFLTSSNMDVWKIKMEAGVIPPEIARDIPYFLIGYFFGWEPDIVDNMDADRVERFIMLIQQFSNAQSNISDINKMPSNR